MKTCSNCHAPNRDEAKFCGFCRTPLVVAAPPPEAEPLSHCVLCGHENERLAKFCAACGGSMKSSTPPPVMRGSYDPLPPTTVLGGASLRSEPPAPTPIREIVSPYTFPSDPAEPRVEPEIREIVIPAREGSAPDPEPAPEPAASEAMDIIPTPVPAPLAALPAPLQDRIECGACGSVIQYCPCCGTPISQPQHQA